MKEIQTDYGKVYVLNRDQIFARIVKELERICKEKSGAVTIGLTGGSTPKEFYKWIVAKDSLKPNVLSQIIWMTSDERYLPLESEESNFGNADRLMLRPLGVSEDKKRPWKVEIVPQEAATNYNSYFTGDKCFDLCMLGMGDDCHIASVFPGSPLIGEDPEENFVAIDVPKKGMRLTTTPNGLKRSSQVLMIVTGETKSLALKKVLQGDYNPNEKPAQLNRKWAEKVIWLVDDEAACKL